MPNPIVKLKTQTAGGTLTMSVTKTGGPVVTRAVVGSTGTDDRTFTDAQLTPGPANMPLLPPNSYSVVWIGAFVADGSATFQYSVAHTGGGSTPGKPVTVKGKAGDAFFRVVLIP